MIQSACLSRSRLARQLSAFHEKAALPAMLRGAGLDARLMSGLRGASAPDARLVSARTAVAPVRSCLHRLRPSARRPRSASRRGACVVHAASLAEQDAQFQELRSLCGASSGELRLDEGAFGRGLFCAEGARCAEVLLSVPLAWALVVRGDLDDVDPDAILTSRVFQLHKQWEAATGATLPDELLIMIDSAFPAEQRLAFWLLYAIKNGGELWQRLGALLPGTDECPSPLLWRDEDLRELQDVAFSMQLSAARQTAARGFEGFLEAWPLGPQLHAALGHPTAQDFVWALAMVQSRGMADELPAGAAGGAPERVAMLVPFADMANHVAYDPGFSGAVDDSGDAFSLTCCRVDGVARGAELTVSYRDGASNLEIMRKYGFVTPRNPNDWFMFSTKNPAQVRDMAVDRARLEPLVRAAAKPDSLVLGYLPAVLGSLPAQPPEEAQRSTLAEQAARAAALHAALLQEQAAFTTSLEEDDALLARGGLSVRLEAAVLFRRERKRLFKAAADAVNIYATAASRVVAKAAAAAPSS